MLSTPPSRCLSSSSIRPHFSEPPGGTVAQDSASGARRRPLSGTTQKRPADSGSLPLYRDTATPAPVRAAQARFSLTSGAGRL